MNFSDNVTMFLVQVAIKIIPKLHAENLTREIHHHRYLHHPNIISLLEVIPTETEIYMVLEYCEGGELYDFLVERGRLRENLARKMFGQLCRAVKYCHDRRVVHRYELRSIYNCKSLCFIVDLTNL